MTADQIPPVVEEPRASLFSNFIAIVGLIILIVVVIWGLIHLVGLSQEWFSNFFNRSPKVTVTAPREVVTGEEFSVSWKYSGSEKGNYAFLYQCKAGLELKSSQITIPCGTSYTVGTATTLSFTPTLSGVASTSMPVSVVFLPSATSSQRVQGSTNILVLRESQSTETPRATTTTSTPRPPTPTTPPPAPTPRPPVVVTPPPAPVVPQGPADLSVRLIGIGVIDRYTGQFVQRAPMYPDDIAAAQFDIANVGGSASGTYYFSANLPTTAGYVYNSPAQAPLNPGDHVINTLRWTFSAPVGTFTVAVSGDTNSANNYASATIGGGYYAQPGYQYGNQYSQPIYYQPYTY